MTIPWNILFLQDFKNLALNTGLENTLSILNFKPILSLIFTMPIAENKAFATDSSKLLSVLPSNYLVSWSHLLQYNLNEDW